jgi:hypothetical protein
MAPFLFSARTGRRGRMGRMGEKKKRKSPFFRKPYSLPFVPFSLFSPFFPKKNVNNAFKSFFTKKREFKKKLHQNIPYSFTNLITAIDLFKDTLGINYTLYSKKPSQTP